MGHSLTAALNGATWAADGDGVCSFREFELGTISGLGFDITGIRSQPVGAPTEPWTGISGDPPPGGTYTPALDLREISTLLRGSAEFSAIARRGSIFS